MTDPYGDLPAIPRRVLTVSLLSCAFLGMLDGTVTGTAMPRIVAQLGGTGTWYVWVVTAYLLTSTVTVPLYGRFSDLYGRRGPMLIGLGIFLAGSLACGSASSITLLIGFRAIQGVGAGALLTVGMSALRDLYPPQRMAGMVRMQSAMAVLMVAGLIGGPIVGGVLADYAGWRWAFLLNLPIGLPIAALLAVLLPRVRAHADGQGRPSHRTDVAGILLLTGGLSLLLLGLSLKGNVVNGEPRPWTDPAIAGPLLLGLALIGALLAVERRAEVPIVPLRLFRSRPYAAIAAAGFCFQAASLPVGLFVPLYLQQVRGLPATVSALLLLPLLGGMVLGNRLTAAVVMRTGQVKPVLLLGASLLAAGSLPFLALDDGTPLALIAGCLLLAGLGTGPGMGGVSIVAQNSVERPDIGTATAGSMLSKQIGGSVSLAIGQSLAGAQLAGAGAAASIGATVAWLGGTGGLLAVAALLCMPNLVIGGGPPAVAPSAKSA
jgi:MFS family permease